MGLPQTWRPFSYFQMWEFLAANKLEWSTRCRFYWKQDDSPYWKQVRRQPWPSIYRRPQTINNMLCLLCTCYCASFVQVWRLYGAYMAHLSRNKVTNDTHMSQQHNSSKWTCNTIRATVCYSVISSDIWSVKHLTCSNSKKQCWNQSLYRHRGFHLTLWL